MTDEEKEKAENELFEKLEPIYDENGNLLSNEEAFRLSDEFKEIQEQIRRLQPTRIGIMKRYWDKFRYNKNRRQGLIEMFDASDEQA